jgi:hydroxymethylpyrimidine/phosphomethylpyrimidine kinase
MPQASLNALIVAYQAQIDWLLTQATELESGERKLTGQMRGTEVDLSANIAAEYRHKAGNMQAILQAYERLHAKGA